MSYVPLGHVLEQKDMRGAVSLPLLGVSVATGVRPRTADDGRPAPSLDLSGYKQVATGDIVMNALGKPHGSIGRSPVAGITSPAYWVLCCRAGLDSRFAHHLLRSHWAVQRFAGLGKNLPPNQFDIPWEVFRGIEAWIPSEPAQRRIADFLDDRVARIDQIIAARRGQMASVQEQERSIADELLSRTDASWPRLGLFLRGIEQGWSPQCDAIPAEEGEWGVIKVGAVQPGWFQPLENKRLPDDLSPMSEYELSAGDLLVSRANTPDRVGFFALVPDGVRRGLILCDKVMRLQVDDTFMPEFVALVGQSRRTRDALIIAGTGTSGSMVNIRGDDLRDLRVPLVSLSVQQDLVQTWRKGRERTQDASNGLVRSIELLSEYKQSLITAAVTGEIDVTTAGSGIPG